MFDLEIGEQARGSLLPIMGPELPAKRGHPELAMDLFDEPPIEEPLAIEEPVFPARQVFEELSDSDSLDLLLR